MSEQETIRRKDKPSIPEVTDQPILVDVDNLVQPVFGANKLKVRISDEDWRETEDGSGVVVTVIRDGERLKDVSVVKDSDNCWTVAYNISQDGDYEYIVTVDGVEAKNSPFKRVWCAEPPRGCVVDIGQDWKWGKQNGEGYGVLLGYGKEVKASENWVKARWRNGRQNNYRWGAEGAYDLMLISVPAPSVSAVEAAANKEEKEKMYRNMFKEMSILQAKLNKKEKELDFVKTKNGELHKQVLLKTSHETALQKQLDALKQIKAEDSVTLGEEVVEGKWEDHSADMKNRIYKGLIQELEKLRTEKVEREYPLIKTEDFAVQFDYWVPMEDLLHGASVVDEKVFNVQGSGEQFFDWSECGFSLHVPEGALLGTETCPVAVKALVAGNFKFPDNTQLISGLYAISAARVFRKPVQTTIQHCLKVERKSQVIRMHFIKAHQTQKGMPYIFGIEDGGDFEIGSQFGSFWQTSFSNLGIVLEDQLHPVPVDDGDTSGSSDHDEEEGIDEEQDEEEEEEEEKDDPVETTSTENEEDHTESQNNLPVKNVSVNEPSVASTTGINKPTSDTSSISSVLVPVGPSEPAVKNGAVALDTTLTEEVNQIKPNCVMDSQKDDEIPNDLLPRQEAETTASTSRRYTGERDEILYHALTFYELKARHRYEHRFVAIKSLPAHIKYVQSSPAFCSQEQGKSFQFCFNFCVPDPRITLEFREPDLEGKLDGCCIGKGWRVEPDSTPSRITKGEIDSLGQELQVQGQDRVPVYPVIPTCMTCVYATATTTDNLRYPVPIQGMVEQKTIYIQRFIDEQEPAVPSQQQTMDVPDLTTSSLPVLQNLQSFDVNELTAIVKNVLSKNENRLKELLQHSLEAFAGNMQEASLIDQYVARDPSYSKIIDQFVASMSYMEEKEEVEEHCTTLLKALRNVGGPLVLPCKAIKKQLIKEVKEKLKLDLTLPIDF